MGIRFCNWCHTCNATRKSLFFVNDVEKNVGLDEEEARLWLAWASGTAIGVTPAIAMPTGIRFILFILPEAASCPR